MRQSSRPSVVFSGGIGSHNDNAFSYFDFGVRKEEIVLGDLIIEFAVVGEI